MGTPTLSIIIINFNTPFLVYECIKSILKWLDINYEIVVVENGSNQESRIEKEELSKLIEGPFQLVVSEENLGFGKGNNLGAQKAFGDILWFLNSDTLLNNDSVPKLVEFLKIHKELGAVSPLIYHPDGKLQKNFFAKFQSLSGVIFRHYNYCKVDLTKEYFTTDIVIGAAMMIRKNIFEKIGGFDPNIFMYLEDDDLCKRLVDAGYENAVYTGASIVHKEGASINKNSSRKKLYYDSQTYFWKKHNGAIPTLLMRILRLPYKTIKTWK